MTNREKLNSLSNLALVKNAVLHCSWCAYNEICKQTESVEESFKISCLEGVLKFLEAEYTGDE